MSVFVGWRTPFPRRMQTLAVLGWFLFLFPLGAYVTTFVLLVVIGLNPVLWPLFVLYCVWAYGFDSETPKRDGRVVPALLRLSMWKKFAEFFPIRLHSQSGSLCTAAGESATAPCAKIFAFHPHGVISVGACNAALLAPHTRHIESLQDGSVLGEQEVSSAERQERRQLLEELANHRIQLLTLSMNFKIPFYRDALLAFGIGDCSERSIRAKLSRGISVGIVVGGAAESLDAHPNTPIKLTLKRRRGFVRLALATGAPLVPVLSFGENDIFGQAANPVGSRLRAFQERFKNLFGFAPAFAFGRGVFNLAFGLLPRRHPINTVFGTPLQMPHIPSPSKEQIAEHHARYIAALKALHAHFVDRFDTDHKILEVY